MSALPCGCDPEEHDYKCERHREEGIAQMLEQERVRGPRIPPSAIMTACCGEGETAGTPGVQSTRAACPSMNPVSDPGWVESGLRTRFPYGHPRFLPITMRELQLHSDKNHDYAKGGPPLGNFLRVAQILALYPNLQPSDERVVALVYALKQLDAVLWGMSAGIAHKVEGANQRLQDISVYCKLVMCMNEDKERRPDEDH